MSAPRCKPNDLCEIVHSMAGNEGRRGIVERAADSEDWNLGNGSLLGLEPHCWVLRRLQPLREVQRLHGGQTIVSVCMEPTIYPDAWLRPIRDEDNSDLAISESVGEVVHS